MIPSSKKFIPLSAYDYPRLVTEHTTRAQAAEKVLYASNHIHTINSEPARMPDRNKLISDDKYKMLASRAEGYIVNLEQFSVLYTTFKLKSCNIFNYQLFQTISDSWIFVVL